MSGVAMFGRHELGCVPFSSEAFSTGMGRRLAEAGLEDVAHEMAALGVVRHFLETSLTAEQVRSINSKEAIAVAEDAARFQERVARVEIRENGEPVHNLRQMADQDGLSWTFSRAPYHPACGEWAGKQRLFWVRSRVAEGLRGITAALEDADYSLHFEDGFRPLGVQEGLFKRRYQMARTAHPEWSHDETLLEARSKTAYTPRFAAHKGAAAIDVRVRDLRNGELLDIGHDYPDGGALVALDAPLVTQRQWENRYVLATLAARSGMAMYPFEDWHVCMGDTTASACVEGDDLPAAVYGPIKKFNAETGEIEDVYTRQELDQVFEVL